MYREPLWLVYVLLTVGLGVVVGVALTWWMGLLMGLGFATLPALAWVTTAAEP